MKKFSGLITAIIILAILYTGFWFYQAERLKKIVNYHVQEYAKPNAEGYHVKVEDVSVHGYPFSYEVALKNPRYEKVSDSQQPAPAKMAVEGAIKIGTDILGKSYWIKQEGDITYKPQTKEDSKKYVVKGNMDLSVDVAHPQFSKSILHPFFGLPKVFYQESLSFQELLNELKMARYTDHDFAIYETDGNSAKELLRFSNGFVQWSHAPRGTEDERFAFSIDLKDFEAAEQGAPLLPHLKKLMDMNTDLAIDIPYILGSGKNNISMDFEAILPQNFQVGKFFKYDNLNIALKNFQMDNLYGNTSLHFDLGLREREEDSRILHLSLNGESRITEKGSEAIHSQFLRGLKQQVASNSSDPESKVLAELLQCCQENLKDLVPNYDKLGDMQFNFNTDVKVNNISKNPTVEKITLHNLDAVADPYAIKSHGLAEFPNDQPRGTFEINWINFREMIHDAVAYYNRIRPIFEKFSQANKQQPLMIDTISPLKEREIIDFFKSISNDPTTEDSTITITIDFTNMADLKIGHNSAAQVKEAWSKLVSDLKKTELKKPAQKTST